MDRIVIIGGGIAGLATAYHLAPLPVTLIAGAPLATEAATAWAQGGIAAAIGEGDSPALHAADTLAAGAGIGDPQVAQRVATAAPEAIEFLASLGAPFDRDADGHIALGLEAAHSRRRIVHAAGDGTGRAVLETLIRAVRALPSVDIWEDARASDLVLDHDGKIAGVMVARNGAREFLLARAVVLATGGIGGLYAHTTNPLGAVGTGLAMAARAGAVLRDVEFVQFHPTAIALGRDPMPLATEALRGEGAVLVNGRGERFMMDVPGAELAARDIVARSIWREIERGEKVFLDAREAVGARFPQRFPSVTALCRDLGLDPVSEPIPVRPAAHYHMGGVKVDATGRSSIAGLWACGEVASTGLHGANRLASNSLLEALAFGRRIAEDIASIPQQRLPRPAVLPPALVASPTDAGTIARIRQIMETQVGVMRERTGLVAALGELDALSRRPDAASDLATVGLLVAAAAVERDESRGGHFCSDHPAPLPEQAASRDITLAEARGIAADLAAAPRVLKRI